MILLQVSSVVSPSTACKEKWLEISLLCDRWTSRGGGLSTLNRELTVHMGWCGLLSSFMRVLVLMTIRRGLKSTGSTWLKQSDS